MSLKKITILALLVSALSVINCPTVLFAGEEYGTDSPETRKTLRGITAIYPFVSIEGAGKRLGLDEKQLQTDVELKLRLAGIPVISRDEAIAQSLPSLFVQILIDDTLWEKGMVTKSVEVSLFQDVWLRRDKTMLTKAITWRHGAQGYVLVESPDYVVEEVREKMDVFVNAYLSVNPKP